MKKPDAVLRELGQLHDFYRELAKFRFKNEQKSKAVAPDRETASLVPRPAAPGR